MFRYLQDGGGSMKAFEYIGDKADDLEKEVEEGMDIEVALEVMEQRNEEYKQAEKLVQDQYIC